MRPVRYAGILLLACTGLIGCAHEREIWYPGHSIQMNGGLAAYYKQDVPRDELEQYAEAGVHEAMLRLATLEYDASKVGAFAWALTLYKDTKRVDHLDLARIIQPFLSSDDIAEANRRSKQHLELIKLARKENYHPDFGHDFVLDFASSRDDLFRYRLLGRFRAAARHIPRCWDGAQPPLAPIMGLDGFSQLLIARIFALDIAVVESHYGHLVSAPLEDRHYIYRKDDRYSRENDLGQRFCDATEKTSYRECPAYDGYGGAFSSLEDLFPCQSFVYARADAASYLPALERIAVRAVGKIVVDHGLVARFPSYSVRVTESPFLGAAFLSDHTLRLSSGLVILAVYESIKAYQDPAYSACQQRAQGRSCSMEDEVVAIQEDVARMLEFIVLHEFGHGAQERYGSSNSAEVYADCFAYLHQERRSGTIDVGVASSLFAYNNLMHWGVIEERKPTQTEVIVAKENIARRKALQDRVVRSGAQRVCSESGLQESGALLDTTIAPRTEQELRDYLRDYFSIHAFAESVTHQQSISLGEKFDQRH